MGLRCTRAFSSCGGKAFHCGRNRRQASSGLGGGVWRQASGLSLKRPSSRAHWGPGEAEKLALPTSLERPERRWACALRSGEEPGWKSVECGGSSSQGHWEFCGLWSWWAGRQWRWGLLCGCGVPRGVAGEDRPGGCALARIRFGDQQAQVLRCSWRPGREFEVMVSEFYLLCQLCKQSVFITDN